MNHRSILQLSGALAVVGGLAVTGLLLQRGSHPSSSHAAPDASLYTANAIRPAAPPASAPLLVREAWLMHWQPSWLQQDWTDEGRPPILWSSSDRSYYVPTPSGGNILLTFPQQWEFVPTSAFPSWFNRPLRP